MRSIPKNRTRAGKAQMENMMRQTPSMLPPSQAPRIAFMTNAASWPATIAISLRPVMEPRISWGASSARYTGTTVDAPPTATPSMMRPATSTSKPTGEKVPGSGPAGEKTTNTVPTKNRTASATMVLRRPHKSAICPDTSAPSAAAKTSELITTPTCKRFRPSSAAIGPSAPLATPVSYPKSSPPKQATIEIKPRRLECGPEVSGGKLDSDARFCALDIKLLRMARVKESAGSSAIQSLSLGATRARRIGHDLDRCPVFPTSPNPNSFIERRSVQTRWPALILDASKAWASSRW